MPPDDLERFGARMPGGGVTTLETMLQTMPMAARAADARRARTADAHQPWGSGMPSCGLALGLGSGHAHVSNVLDVAFETKTNPAYGHRRPEEIST